MVSGVANLADVLTVLGAFSSSHRGAVVTNTLIFDTPTIGQCESILT